MLDRLLGEDEDEINGCSITEEVLKCLLEMILLCGGEVTLTDTLD